MARKSTPKRDDPAQSDRFIETAKAVGADAGAAGFERAFKTVVGPKKMKQPS